MTWDDLRAFLNDMHQRLDERLGDNVTVYCAGDGEYFPADAIEFEEEDDVLPQGSIMIVIQN